jgi:putative peptidoglycan lipid II flippase
MAANMLFNIVFVVPMVWLDLPGPHAGLALATSLSAFLNAGLLFRTLRRDGVFRAQPGWGRFTLRLALANGALLGGLLWTAGSVDSWLAWGTAERAAALGLTVAGGVGGYFLLLFALGLRPRELLGRAPPRLP